MGTYTQRGALSQKIRASSPTSAPDHTTRSRVRAVAAGSSSTASGV